ncbi:NAD(P)-dependent oxidoreductase [Aldersonia sp. NBC_00410]|uniref:NAD(P)-dependent oxidoreductase n=1 Tax=Aldersonia sp. NBC_00410 TaxID=2975954 RepID=UPI0022519FBA|nr:NAD(P)-dependent oxidoreductase [Aldersonia sp. NBC_00410]MCX5044248.1 NAD(P)-dependent oxidoreductase [Aldersonia sp. NBC_00410]
MRVGFIGLGSQGAPMARRIVDEGFPTTLWARRPESLAPFADTAAETAATPAELGAASDVVCICVVADDDVRNVVTGEDGVLGGMAEGGVLVIHSTVHPDTCAEIAGKAAARGVAVIDAPVSGGGIGAAERRLLVMVGGDAEALERCRPIFETYANPIVHLGELGAGQVTKLLNNLLFTAGLAIGQAALDLGEQLGVDRARLGEVISSGSGNSFALSRVVSPTGLDLIGNHAGGVLRKDVGLIADIAETAAAAPGIVLTAADATLERMGKSR